MTMGDEQPSLEALNSVSQSTAGVACIFTGGLWAKDACAAIARRDTKTLEQFAQLKRNP